MEWIETKSKLPPEGEIVETKIDDADGARNECRLYHQRRPWYVADGSMYVYYTPTHWRSMAEASHVCGR